MLKIWGRLSSINVKKVVWTAQELGLDFQRTEAGGLFGVVKTPEYMRLNPNSLVPVIEDDDFVLWESNVIVRYLCAKYDTPTLAASRAALPPEGARLAWGGPARRPSSGLLYPTDLRERLKRLSDWPRTHNDSGEGPMRTHDIERACNAFDLLYDLALAICGHVADYDQVRRMVDPDKCTCDFEL